jgi:hypothetical protein
VEEVLVLGRVEPGGTDLLEAEAGAEREEPLVDLGAAHLEAEHRGGLPFGEGDVGGDRERERALPHRRPGGEDDQVPGLQAGGDRVEEADPGGEPGDGGVAELGDPPVRRFHADAERLEVARRVLLPELVDELLRLVDQDTGVAVALDAELVDLLPGPDDRAHLGELPHDLRVVADVRARRDDVRELVDAGAAAGLLERAVLVELVDEDRRVDRVAVRVHPDGGVEDQAVRGPVEVVPVDVLGRNGERVVADEHRAEDVLFGLEVLGVDVGRHRVRSGGAGVVGQAFTEGDGVPL